MRNVRKRSLILHLIFNFSFFFLLIVFTSCQSVSPVDGQGGRLDVASSPERISPRWEAVPVHGTASKDAEDTGLAYFAGKVTRPSFEFNALRIDLANPGLRLLAAGGGRSLDDGNFLSIKVSSFVRDNKLLAGINALPFDPVSDKEGEPRTNIGIVISNGEMVSPPHSRFDALVYYADGSIKIVNQSEIKSAENIETAVGGFYQILQNGEPVQSILTLKAHHPRSAAGISADGRYLYLLVIDGRRPGSAGSTEAETAIVLRSLGATEGINFDGGGSSALVLRYPNGRIRAVNTPIHGQSPGKERAVAGCLGVTVR